MTKSDGRPARPSAIPSAKKLYIIRRINNCAPKKIGLPAETDLGTIFDSFSTLSALFYTASHSSIYALWKNQEIYIYIYIQTKILE